MNSPNRALPWLLLANLAIAGFAVFLALVHGERPDLYFMEGKFTTWVSCAQLLIVAALAAGVYLARRRVGAPGARLWLLMAIGFVYLAADDAFEFHENFDFWVHRFFHIRETPLTDRIDDAVIALYALGSLVVLWICRRELVPFRALQLSMIAGIVFSFGSIICDTVSNRIDVELFLVHDRVLAKALQYWIGAGDDICKLLAEGCFIAAFFGAWRLAPNTSPANLTPSTTESIPP